MEAMAKEPELLPLRLGPATTAGAVAVITRRAVDRLREGSAWVYRSDIVHLLPAAGSYGAVDPGSIVTVHDQRGTVLGSALFSAASQITLRLISERPELTRADYLADLESRLEAALALRRELAPEDSRQQRLPPRLFRG